MTTHSQPPNLAIKTLPELDIKLLDRSGSIAVFEFEVPKYLLVDFIKEGFTFSDVIEKTPYLYYATRAWVKEDGTPVERRGRFRNASLAVVEVFHKGYETYKQAISVGMDPHLAKQLLSNANLVRVVSSALLVTWEDFANRLLKSRSEDKVYFGSKIKALLNEK